ncbi:hypothetical protein [Bacillus sp. FJAT-27251]|uniref:hypothetical protein n=1 Tax=Bacillus sp. FJAT-27251 TaxID=1684142 RepID=UPI0012E1828F|nr:hypothetical protein [Bacillus sp. FJAT-27251]
MTQIEQEGLFLDIKPRPFPRNVLFPQKFAPIIPPFESSITVLFGHHRSPQAGAINLSARIEL